MWPAWSGGQLLRRSVSSNRASSSSAVGNDCRQIEKECTGFLRDTFGNRSSDRSSPMSTEMQMKGAQVKKMPVPIIYRPYRVTTY